MLNDRLMEAGLAFAYLDPDHSGDPDDIRVKWEYDEDDDSFRLTVASSYEVNTSCSCHPEYERRYRETHHVIPQAEIAPSLDFTNEQGEPVDPWVFAPQALPSYQAAAAEIEAKREAEKKAREEAARQQREIHERQQRAAEEREFERLRAKLGKN